jgi:hypothetical protein
MAVRLHESAFDHAKSLILCEKCVLDDPDVWNKFRTGISSVFTAAVRSRPNPGTDEVCA